MNGGEGEGKWRVGVVTLSFNKKILAELGQAHVMTAVSKPETETSNVLYVFPTYIRISGKFPAMEVQSKRQNPNNYK